MECFPKEEIVGLLERLNEHPIYHERLKKAGITPPFTDIDAEKFARINCLGKKELREYAPFDLFQIPKEDVLTLHASSGTTGSPVTVGFSKNDLANWGELLAFQLRRMGITEKDRIQNAFGYGLFTGGLVWHEGFKTLGATVIPASTGNTERQINLLVNLQVTVLACTPTYALFLAEQIKQRGLLNAISLHSIVIGAEPSTATIIEKIRKILNVEVYDTYGLSESLGPGLASECSHHNGLHVGSYFYPEVKGQDHYALDKEQKGELVITNFKAEAFPILRYETKDSVSLKYHRCACGYEGWSITKVHGRLDDMLCIKGVNFYPSDIGKILEQFPQFSNCFQLHVFKQKNAMDRLELHLEESSQKPFSSKEQSMHIESISKSLKNNLGLKITVKLYPYGLLTEDFKSCKVKRVVFH